MDEKDKLNYVARAVEHEKYYGFDGDVQLVR